MPEGSPEFWNGFVSGVIATLIGFVLTMLWDLWKTRRADRKQAKGVLRALKHECEENVAIVETNHRLLDTEIQLLKQKQQIIPTLVPLKYGLWDVLRHQLPEGLLEDVGLLGRLRDIAWRVDRLNEGLRSRQAYKDTGGAMNNFTERLQLVDGDLVGQVMELNLLLQTAITELAALEGRI